MLANSIYLSMALAIVACVMLFAVSWVPYTSILAMNPCEMTFTNKQLDDRRKLVPLKTNHTSYKLWRYVNDFESDWLDEPQPVLFVPGHQGSADQVRSLASDIMHNKDGPFQYFSVDFGPKWSGSSAIHANNVLAQAMFVNEALVHIQNRCINRQKKSGRGKRTTIDGRPGGGDPPQVTVIAHSAGGIVARTAVLLSNHPARRLGVYSNSSAADSARTSARTAALSASVPVAVQEARNDGNSTCLVSTLLLLSSPISRPEFCLDASLSRLYTDVNRAWLSSYFHTSKQCVGARGRRARADIQGAVPVPSAFPDLAGVTVDWVCPRCVSNIQVVSVTGGLLDGVVSPLSTHVSVITPQPTAAAAENKTASEAVPKGETMISLLVAPHKLLWHVGSFLVGQLVTLPGRVVAMLSSPAAASSNATDSMAAATIDAASTGAVATAAEVCTITVETSTDGSEVEISTCQPGARDKVDLDFGADAAAAELQAPSPAVKEPVMEAEPELLEYIEPQHLSLWASQLMWEGQEASDYHGYPVDHAAQLWCYQLLNSLHEGLVEVTMTNRGRRHADAVSTGVGEHGARNMAAFFNIFVQDGNSSAQYAAEPFPAGQRAAHAARNRMYTALWQDGFAQDMEYLYARAQARLPVPVLSSLYILGIIYITKHAVSAILLCFVVVSLSIFLVPIFRNLCGIVTTAPGVEVRSRASSAPNHGTLALLSPWVHFQLDILAPALYHLLYPEEEAGGKKGGKAGAAGTKVPSTPESRAAQAATWVARWVLLMLALLLVRAIYHFQTMSLGKLVAYYEHPFKWFVSYGAAMVLHYALTLALNTVRVIAACLLVSPVEFVLDWLLCRPLGFVGRLLLFNTVWKVKPVRIFLKKNFGIRRKDKKAPEKKEPLDPAAEAARRRAGLPKSTGSIFVSEEEEEDKTIAADDAVSAASPSMLRVAWIMSPSALSSGAVLAALVLLALLQVGSDGELAVSMQRVHELSTGHFVLAVGSLWLSLLLTMNYASVLFGRRASVMGKNSPSLLGRLAMLRLEPYEAQILVLYAVVVVLAAPNALQSAELLYGASTTAVRGAKSPQLLYWLAARCGLITASGRTHAAVARLADSLNLLLGVLDSNRTFKTISLQNTGHALYGPERVYDMCCLVVCNLHLLALLYWRKVTAQTGTSALSEYGFVGQSEGSISGVALSWCVSFFGLNHPNFSPNALLAGGSFADNVKDPAQMFASGAFSGAGSSGDGTCCHEDGGKYAVFEEVPDPDALSGHGSAGSRGITSCLHSTKFKVIFCACARDKSLTNGVIDYCEYCRCYKCGGKNLPRDDVDSGNSNPAAQAKEALRNLWNTYFNAELLLLCLCTVVLFWVGRTYAAADGLQTNFFRYSHMIAAFSGAFMLYIIVRTYSAKVAALFEKF